LQEIIHKHASIFNPNLPSEGLKTPKFTIKLKPGTPVFRKRYPRRLSPDREAFQNEQTAELLRLNIIEEVTDTVPCAFPTVVALNKTSNKLRFCIDYCELNDATETYMYPIPNIPETIKSLKGKSRFANLDMKLGFHQLLIEEEDRKSTTFITTKGVYRWKRLPFGPKNGPMFFQHTMRNILGDYVDKICKIFIHDIYVFTDNNTEEELIINIDKILTRLAEHNVRLSLSKCSFGNDNVKYLERAW